MFKIYFEEEKQEAIRIIQLERQQKGSDIDKPKKGPTPIEEPPKGKGEDDTEPITDVDKPKKDQPDDYAYT